MNAPEEAVRLLTGVGSRLAHSEALARQAARSSSASAPTAPLDRPRG